MKNLIFVNGTMGAEGPRFALDKRLNSVRICTAVPAVLRCARVSLHPGIAVGMDGSSPHFRWEFPAGNSDRTDKKFYDNEL